MSNFKDFDADYTNFKVKCHFYNKYIDYSVFKLATFCVRFIYDIIKQISKIYVIWAHLGVFRRIWAV